MFDPRVVNKLDMANRGTGPFAFDAMVSNCIVVKTANDAGGVGAVTCNGISLSVIGFVNDTAGWTHQIWALQNSPQGNVSIEITGGGTVISSVESLNGIDTVATFPNVEAHAEHHFGSGALDNIQVSVTTTEDDCILIGLGGYRGPGLTNMFAGSATTTISRNPPTGGEDLSFVSNPVITGPAGSYALQGLTGGGSNGIIISLVVCALTPGPDAVAPKRGSMFLVFP